MRMSTKSNIIDHIVGREYGKTPISREITVPYGEEAVNRPMVPTIVKVGSGEDAPSVLSTFNIAYDKRSQLVATSHGDHTVRIWTASPPRQLWCLRGHARSVWTLSFSPWDNDTLVSGSLGGEVIIWDLKSETHQRHQCENQGAISCAAFHPNSSIVFFAQQNSIFLWAYKNHVIAKFASTAHPGEKIRWVHFDPEGSYLFTGILNLNTNANKKRSSQSNHVSFSQTGLPGADFIASLRRHPSQAAGPSAHRGAQRGALTPAFLNALEAAMSSTRHARLHVEGEEEGKEPMERSPREGERPPRVEPLPEDVLEPSAASALSEDDAFLALARFLESKTRAFYRENPSVGHHLLAMSTGSLPPQSSPEPQPSTSSARNTLRRHPRSWQLREHMNSSLIPYRSGPEANPLWRLPGRYARVGELESHRIQRWPFSWGLQITDRTSHVVVSKCKLHNGASVNMSEDGKRLAVLQECRTQFHVLVVSLEDRTLGQVLWMTGHVPSVVSVSISPGNMFLLVGFHAPEGEVSQEDRKAACKLYRLEENAEGKSPMLMRTIQHPSQFDNANVNATSFLPNTCDGILVGYNQPQLVLHTPSRGT